MGITAAPIRFGNETAAKSKTPAEADEPPLGIAADHLDDTAVLETGSEDDTVKLSTGPAFEEPPPATAPRKGGILNTIRGIVASVLGLEENAGWIDILTKIVELLADSSKTKQPAGNI